jgi:hypothetical protein
MDKEMPVERSERLIAGAYLFAVILAYLAMGALALGVARLIA